MLFTRAVPRELEKTSWPCTVKQSTLCTDAIKCLFFEKCSTRVGTSLPRKH
jgi:hypothetical protein